MAIAFHWESLPFESVDCGSVKPVKLANLANGETIADSLQLNIDSEVDVASWITCCGTE